MCPLEAQEAFELYENDEQNALCGIEALHGNKSIFSEPKPFKGI